MLGIRLIEIWNLIWSLQRMAAAISDAYEDSALLLEYGPFFTILFKLR